MLYDRNTPATRTFTDIQYSQAVRQAKNAGFLNLPTVEFLAQRILGEKTSDIKNLSQKSIAKKLRNVLHLSLCNFRLRELGDISSLLNLRILNISNNYIKDFSALHFCINLIQLDLHSNQINLVPDRNFWSKLAVLKVLHLHDNPITQLGNVRRLSTSNIEVLTLHDTPLSLRKNYRHHTVNSIWTLKLLDYYLISDEEIIEDFRINSNEVFSCFSPYLFFDSSSYDTKSDDYGERIKALQRLCSDINSQMAHSSPVLIVQRFWRGFLGRKQAIIKKNPNFWTAMQEHRKMISRAKVKHGMSKDPFQATGLGAVSSKRRSTIAIPPPPTTPDDLPTERTDLQPVDFDKYIMTLPEDDLEDDSVDMEQILGSKKHLFVDMQKLSKGYSKLDRQLTEPPIMMVQPARQQTESQIGTPEKLKRNQLTAKMFLGQILKNQPKADMEEDDDDEVPFRVRGSPKPITAVDVALQLQGERDDAGLESRDAHMTIHDRVTRRRTEEAAALKLPQVPPPSSSKRYEAMVRKIRTGANLACLVAVDDAYRQRQRQQKENARNENIESMKDRREQSIHQRDFLVEDRRNKIINDKTEERRQIERFMEQRAKHRDAYVKRAKERAQRFKEKQKEMKTNQKFVRTFQSQIGSINRALFTHDHTLKKDLAKRKKKTDHIEVQNDNETQHAMVLRYLEQRAQMRRDEASLSRSAIETHLLEEANQRVMEAKARVQKMKTIRQRVQESMQPLPDSIQTELCIDPKKIQDRWDTLIDMYSGRIGSHPTTMA